MPELKWTYGYFLVIGVVAAICGTLCWRFAETAGFDKP
jgi:Mg2+ and Co2+ transporter CorA